MRTGIVALILAVLAVGLGGCASVDSGAQFNGMALAPAGQSVAHVNAESWGIYLLPMFPILTGDTSSTAGGMAVGIDSCRVEPVVDMATRAAKEKGGARVLDLQSSVSSFPILPPIIWYKSCQVSGNVMK